MISNIVVSVMDSHGIVLAIEWAYDVCSLMGRHYIYRRQVGRHSIVLVNEWSHYILGIRWAQDCVGLWMRITFLLANGWAEYIRLMSRHGLLLAENKKEYFGW
jgi:hypothetical protein